MNTVYRISNGQPYDTPFRVVNTTDEAFAVLSNEYEAEDFAFDVLGREDARLDCFGGYFNAVLLADDEFARFIK